jgi:hypothetical protein
LHALFVLLLYLSSCRHTPCCLAVLPTPASHYCWYAVMLSSCLGAGCAVHAMCGPALPVLLVAPGLSFCRACYSVLHVVLLRMSAGMACLPCLSCMSCWLACPAWLAAVPVLRILVGCICKELNVTCGYAVLSVFAVIARCASCGRAETWRKRATITGSMRLA